MANVRNRTTPTTADRARYTVHGPRNPGDAEEHARFVANLNAELAKISDRFNKMPVLDKSFNPADYVLTADFNDLLDAANTATADQAQDPAASNSTTTISGGNNTDVPTDPGEAAAAAVQAAEPTAPPPAVDRDNKIGTTTSGPNFSLQDHTHRGVTLPLARNYSAAPKWYTLVRPRANTYTGALSVTVDQTGRIQAISLAAAGATPRWDRIFLTMGA